jgi:hypothetical protein
MKKTVMSFLSSISISLFLQAANTCECNISHNKTSTKKTATSVETKQETRRMIYNFKNISKLPECQSKCNSMQTITEKSWDVPQGTATMKVKIK